jgi:hypothetical protein
MFKGKTPFALAFIAVVVAVLVMSCAPAAAPQKPAVPPPATTPTTPTAPTTPTTPEKPAVPSVSPIPKQLQGEEAVRHVDAENGFSIWYPKSWPDFGTGVFAKARQATPGYDSFSVVIEPKQSGKDLLAQLKYDYENSPSMKTYGVEVKPISSGQIKLADGTVANEVITNCVLASGLYNVYLYAIVVDKGDKYIIATGNTIRGEEAQKGVKELTQTFSLDTK